MANRLRALILLTGAALVVLVFSFPLWRPLFTNQVVEEAFPGLTTEEQAAFEQLPLDEQTMYLAMIPTSQPMAVELVRAVLAGDVPVPTAEQAMPEMTDPTIVASGIFTDIDLVHRGSGTATIYQLADNSRLLRFENFRVTNGPNLHVYLTRASAPRAPQDIGTDYIDLGPLKGNIGSQNYPVPVEADLNAYRGVVIYCVAFNVVFSTAALS
jgi:hypothetical protein